jgi:hypothetical protein
MQVEMACTEEKMESRALKTEICLVSPDAGYCACPKKAVIIRLDEHNLPLMSGGRSWRLVSSRLVSQPNHYLTPNARTFGTWRERASVAHLVCFTVSATPVVALLAACRRTSGSHQETLEKSSFGLLLASVLAQARLLG